MISFAQALPIGAAVQVILSPPASAVAWKVLRKTTDTISGVGDPDAGVVYCGDETSFIDVSSLVNGTPYYYQPFYEDATGAWSTAASVSVTPAASAQAIGPDPLELVRSRLEAALKVEVGAGRLTNDLGYIPCFTAPPTFENARFPIVTVHMNSCARAESGIGDTIAAEVFDPISQQWTVSDGALFAIQIEIIGWVVSNADLRIALRKAIDKALIGNFPVFYDQGLLQVEFSQSDDEDFETYESPMFRTRTLMNCVAPMAVEAQVGAIQTVTLDVTTTQ